MCKYSKWHFENRNRYSLNYSALTIRCLAHVIRNGIRFYSLSHVTIFLKFSSFLKKCNQLRPLNRDGILRQMDYLRHNRVPKKHQIMWLLFVQFHLNPQLVYLLQQLQQQLLQQAIQLIIMQHRQSLLPLSRLSTTTRKIFLKLRHVGHLLWEPSPLTILCPCVRCFLCPRPISVRISARITVNWE